MKDTAVLRMSVVGGHKSKKANVRSNPFLYEDDTRENADLLDLAAKQWMNLDKWREEIERNWRYLKGRQWEDLVYDWDSNSYIKESEAIKSQGQIPFVVNLISPIVENIIGQFRASKARPTVIARTRDEAPMSDMLTNTLWSIEDLNKMWEKDSALLEMDLCSAVRIQRVDWGRVKTKKQDNVRYKNVDLSTVFFNQVQDIDLDDLDMIGAFYDWPVDKIVSRFAKTPDDEARIRRMYSHVDREVPDSYDHFSGDKARSRDFMYPASNNLGRVFEIWQKRLEWRYKYYDWGRGKYGYKKLTPESQAWFENENAQRIAMAAKQGIEEDDVALIEYKEMPVHFWYVKYLSSDYHTLFEAESPFDHGEHPFVVSFHRLNRGEVRPFISTLIDIQRSYNRDKILLDFIIGASAKGTFYIDEKHLSDDMNVDQAKAEYTKRNGVIKLDLKPGVKVQDVLGQLTSKAVPAGLNESLAMGQRLMQEMGGISDAIQGRTPGSGMPASLYAQSAQNSTLNIKDRLESFNAFRADRGRKILDTALQFYKEKRYLTVNSNKEAREFDPEKIKDDLDFELTVNSGSDSQVYKSIMDEWLNNYIANGLIPLEVGLKNLSLPNSDQLLTDLEEWKKSQQEAMNGGGSPDGIQAPPNIAPGLMEAIKEKGADANNANQKAVEMMQRYAEGA